MDEDIYKIQFATVLSENNGNIAFVFNKGTDLEEVSKWMLEKYREKKYIERIRYGQNNKFFHVYITNYTFRRAYKLRLLFENDMFEELHAVRASLPEVRKSWGLDDPTNKLIASRANMAGPNMPIIRHDPQQEAWDRLMAMVEKTKEKEPVKDAAEVG
jgi:hypothetical protein